MVYEKKCAECEKMIDFGGRDHGNLPEDAIEFNGDIFCKECIQELVEFGIGDNIMDRINNLEEEMKKVKDAIGLERH